MIKPVIDCANMAPVDAYEIPDRHREAVHLRKPADCFPYSSNTTRDAVVDHTGTRRISDPERAPTTGAPETGRRPKRHHPDLAIAMYFDRPTIDYENPHAA